jgi:hypothetical protein
MCVRLCYLDWKSDCAATYWYRNPISSITVVSRPFVAYLLILAHKISQERSIRNVCLFVNGCWLCRFQGEKNRELDLSYVGSEIVTELTRIGTICWDVTPCNTVEDHRCFGVTSWVVYSSILNMEAVHFSRNWDELLPDYWPSHPEYNFHS